MFGFIHQRQWPVLLICLFPLLAYATSLNANDFPTTPTIYPTNQVLYDDYRFGLLYYYGTTLSNPLGTIFIGQMNHWPEHIQSVELNYTLSEDNPIRRFFSPVVSVVQLAADGTVRNGFNEHTIYEIDPYFAVRWTNLPWNDKLTTSFAVGEGISYDSSVPSLEARSSESTKRLLNFLVFEATFALPSDPRLQFVARIHHRSGAYGLYRAGNTGSNDVGVGIRYLF